MNATVKGVPAEIQGGNSFARVAELDALRGIAAIAVVLFHYTTYYDLRFGHSAEMTLRFNAGHFGVHLFFMISGFVIFMTLQRARSGFDFVKARFFRLFPTYWIAVPLAYVVLRFALRDEPVNRWYLIGNMTMFQGLLGIPNLDGSFWTLQCELLFYLSMLALHFTGPMSTSRLKRVFGAWTLIAISCNLLGRFAILTPNDLARPSLYLFDHHPGFKYFVRFSLLEHIQLFMLGIQFFEIHTNKKLNFGSFFVLALAVINQWLWSTLTDAIMVTFLGVLFYFAIILKFSLFRNPILLFLGTISYSLYLFHQNAGYAIIQFSYRHGIFPIFGVLTAIALLIGFASLTYYCVERPSSEFFRRRRTPQARNNDVNKPLPIL